MSDSKRSDDFFKTCSCSAHWETRDVFLDDPDTRLIGYQADFTELALGLLLFNHSCGTTLAVEAMAFRDLYDGPVYQKSARGSDECPGYCLHRDTLARCPAECECAFVREILQIILDWPPKRRQAERSA